MMKFVCVLVLSLAATVAHAQLHKCVNAAGKVEYRDTLCNDAADRTGMSGGTVSGVQSLSAQEMQRAHSLMEAERRQQPAKAAIIGGTTAGRPSEQDIRNLETAASSKTLSAKEKKFLAAEVERAKAAARGDGTYTEADMRRLKDAQAAQNNIRAQDRAAARQDAEGTHLKAGGASQAAGIARAHQEEADRAAARRAAAARAAQQDAQRAAGQGSPFLNCSNGACSDSQGRWYYPKAGGTVMRSDGTVCRQQGDRITC